MANEAVKFAADDAQQLRQSLISNAGYLDSNVELMRAAERIVADEVRRRAVDAPPCSYAAEALGGFKEAPRPAVQALLNALSDNNWLVRLEAKFALRKIAPEALERAWR